MSLTSNAGGDPPRASRLLAALPGEDYERLLPHLKPVKLARGEILYDSGDRTKYLYFPTNSIVSLFYTMKSGTTAEMAMVGSFGVIGFSAFLGGESALHQAVVQIAGDAYRIRAIVLQEEFARGGALQRLLLHYTQALITQISQISVCNRLHTFEQRLCRWLLLCLDRVKSDEIVLTQEMISHLLGVRREGITVAAGRLQDAGVIRYARGRINILDRLRLEACACECYRVIKDEYERLLALKFFLRD